MDTRFVDRELAAWERLLRLAGERGIELPPELAVECGEDSLSWSEAKCIAYLESEVARRLAGLASTATRYTGAPLAPGRPLAPRTEVPARPVVQRVARRRMDCEPGCQCVLCHSAGLDPGERVQTTGRPAQLKNIRAEEHYDRKAAAAARRARR